MPFASGRLGALRLLSGSIAWHLVSMSHVIEVSIILGCPDYDVPLAAPSTRQDGLKVTGRDSLDYLWRFAEQRASLWALKGGTVGRSLGEIALGRAVPTGIDAQCELLRAAQARRREVQTAYVHLVETLLSMAGDTPKPELQARLHAIRIHCADDLLIFTDPADAGAHAEFRPLPEITAMTNTSPEDQTRLRPLASSILETKGTLLGIEDPESLLALTARSDF